MSLNSDYKTSESLRSQKKMIFKAHFSICLIVALFFALTISDTCHSRPFSDENAGLDVWTNIEDLQYKVYRGMLPIGYARLLMQESGDYETLRLRAFVRTNAIASLIVPVDSWAESLVKKEDYSSLSYHEEAYFKRKYFRFFADFSTNPGRGLIYAIKKGLPRPDNVEHLTLQNNMGLMLAKVSNGLPINIYDPISVLYALRWHTAKGYVPDHTEAVITFLDLGAKPVYFSHIGREKIRVPSGRFECIRIRMKMEVKSVLPPESIIDIYLTDDNKRIPVLLRYNIPGIGRGTIELTRFKHNENSIPLGRYKTEEGKDS